MICFVCFSRSAAGLRPDGIVGMVNMDMVGRLRDDRLQVLGGESARLLLAIVHALQALRQRQCGHRMPANPDVSPARTVGVTCSVEAECAGNSAGERLQDPRQRQIDEVTDGEAVPTDRADPLCGHAVRRRET